MEQRNIAFIGARQYGPQPDQRINQCRFSGNKIHATDIDALKAQELGKEFGITGSNDNVAAVKMPM